MRVFFEDHTLSFHWGTYVSKYQIPTTKLSKTREIHRGAVGLASKHRSTSTGVITNSN